MTSLKAFKDSLHTGDKVRITNCITAVYKPEVATQERIVLSVEAKSIVTGALLTHDEAIDYKLDKWHANPVEYKGNYYLPIHLTLQKVKDMIITDTSISLLVRNYSDEPSEDYTSPFPDIKAGQPWLKLEKVVD